MRYASVVCAALLMAAGAATVAAQAIAGLDSAVARVQASDGATELVLHSDRLEFRFTEAGAERIVRDASAGSEWQRLVERSVRAGVGGMRMSFPLASVRDIAFEGDALIVTFAGRPSDAAADSDRGRFVYERVAAAEAAAFIRAFRLARGEPFSRSP